MKSTNMSYTDWLKRQVTSLEEELRSSSVFDEETPATPAQLHDLRAKVVIHTYLKQQLLRREPAAPLLDEELDTQEYRIVRA
jgi:hypothetical protein